MVLHISNGYLGLSNVHQSLYRVFDKKGVNQIIFAPVRKDKAPRKERNINFENKDSKIIFSRRLEIHHKVLFRNKINFLYEDLIKGINPNEIELSHATTLYSDGAIALRLFEKYGIPYIVTVRSTDLVFNKYRPDLSSLARKILLYAEKIVFVNKSMPQKLLKSNSFRSISSRVSQKVVLSNNGVDKIWLSNKSPKKDVLGTPINILYVGRFTKPKNIIRLIKAVEKVNSTNKGFILTIVGGKGRQKKKVVDLASRFQSFINFVGPIYDREELIKQFRRNDIFAMPSYKETFGQVYIEALSQGLPVLYAKNEGIDGVLSENIGEKVDPYSISAISRGLERMVNDYGNYDLVNINFDHFDWNIIAEQYINIYNSIVSKKTINE